MNTLIIYDENGTVFFTTSGDDMPSSVGTAMIEVPDGKEVDYVDTKTGEVILKDKVKTEAERIAELEAQMAALTGTEE